MTCTRVKNKGNTRCMKRRMPEINTKQRSRFSLRKPTRITLEFPFKDKNWTTKRATIADLTRIIRHTSPFVHETDTSLIKMKIIMFSV